MPKLFVTTRDGDEKVVEAAAGRSVMQIIRDAGIDDTLGMCGGGCSCCSCHVHVDEAMLASLPPISADESSLLDCSSTRDERSRLACQIPFSDALDGLRVTIAQED